MTNYVLIGLGVLIVVLTVVAVAFNVAMIFGVLSLLNATLTLPGIIGIVLTIGIAVDSNVLIYERIREEVRAGRTAVAAMKVVMLESRMVDSARRKPASIAEIALRPPRSSSRMRS